MKNVNRVWALVLALILALGMIGALAATPNASSTVAISTKNFPDKTFREYVKKFDKDNNGKLSAKEIKAVKRIDLSERTKIANLKGIEHFTALTQLICYRTSIKKLDVSKNTKLKSLDVCETKLTSLKLGKQKSLVNLLASYIGSLKSIDIGGCPKLLKAIKGYYYIEDDTATWPITPDDSLNIDTSTKLMNGKTVVRKYAKPTSFKFTKKSITMKVDQTYNLWSIISLKPATAFYPIKFTSSDESVAEVWGGESQALKKGTTTITAYLGKKKLGSIKVTVK